MQRNEIGAMKKEEWKGNERMEMIKKKWRKRTVGKKKEMNVKY